MPPSTTSPTEVPSIALVGGGIAGLVLALHLLKLADDRYTVTLYESAQAFGEIGAGVSFGPNAQHAMRCISPEVYAAFEETETHNQDPDRRDVWFDFRYGESVGGRHDVEGEREGHAGTGSAGGGADAHGGGPELIATVRAENGQSGVKRSDFLDALVRHLPDGVARFGKRFTHYTLSEGGGGVVLHFRDGTSAAHTALVGCDGIKSAVRKCLLGPDDPAARAVFSGKFCYRGLIPMDRAAERLGPRMARNAQMYLGRHGHILTFAIEKGRVMNVVAFGSAESWDDPNWVVAADTDKMRADFAGWCPAAASIIGMMQNTDVWALFDHPAARTYVSADGRACLAGDAAHATTPHKGSGAGMAIEDAFLLGNLISAALDRDGRGKSGRAGAGGAISAAFRVYDATRRARTQRLVEDSRATGRLYDLELDQVGHDKQKLREQLLTRMKWVWEHDVLEEWTEVKSVLNKQLVH